MQIIGSLDVGGQGEGEVMGDKRRFMHKLLSNGGAINCR